MSEFADQVKEIETLITSKTKSDKSLGYSTLLHLQEQSTQHTSAIESLSERLHHLLTSTVHDIVDEDEEISSLALKCLGFMIYHPSLVTAIPEDVADLVVESVVRLITTTKVKTVCNLGVWCISIQQFKNSVLASHFNSLLRAVIHALDNPTGSLSTTFEATQAVIKLVGQLTEKMRDSSNIWAPVIYRRLLSGDKRQRDMTERCLLKIKSIILPPPLALSKALVSDMKKKLLPEMKEVVQDHERKVSTIQAWGWYIRLLGSHALKNRQLVNDMLKIPERTFSDSDPQVQIASQVAWEGLVDALIHPPAETIETNIALRHVSPEKSPMALNKCDYEKTADGFSKSLRLIMTPLVGIMSSKCDISVHSSCLNTWCYVLKKLDLLVNHPSVIKTVFEPILEAVFQMGIDDKKIWLWNFCLDLLDDFVSPNNRERENESSQQVSSHSSTEASSLVLNNVAKCYSKDYPVKWVPWDLSKVESHLKVFHIIIGQGSVTTLTAESRSLARNAALRVFRSVLKGIQNEMKKSSIHYSDIMLCLSTILNLIKQLCRDATTKESNDLLHISIHLIEATQEELDPFLLASPLYRVALDLDYISNLQLAINAEYPEVPEIKSIKYMDTVSPAVYLTLLHLCVAAQSISSKSLMITILHGMDKHLKFILSSHDPLENLNAIIHFLYKHKEFAWLKIWELVANNLKEHIEGVNTLRTKMGDDGYVAVCWFLSYPFLVCLYPQQPSNLVEASCSELSHASFQVELENVVETWKLLFGSINSSVKSDCSTMAGFSEDLCGILHKLFSEKTSMPDGGIELCENEDNNKFMFLLLFGEVAIYLLNQVLVFNNEVLLSKASNGNKFLSTSITNSLEFIARYLRLSLEAIVCNPPADHSRTSRVFSALAGFVGRLRLKHHILLLIEILSDPLVQWLSTLAPMQEGSSVMSQLKLLWTEILGSLKRSRPPINFNSSFLKVQASTLENTLDHPDSSIRESTIIFWNYTYGNQVNLEYPPSLLPVLDKLSRQGKINIHKGSPQFLASGHSKDITSAPLRYKVAAIQKKFSKRIELMEDKGNENTETVVPGTKRKRLELTEHQKEVRRAQQGLNRDCSGHGPGIRTYTSADFSQGNEDSQESQEIRNPDAILELLRKVP